MSTLFCTPVRDGESRGCRTSCLRQRKTRSAKTHRVTTPHWRPRIRTGAGDYGHPCRRLRTLTPGATECGEAAQSLVVDLCWEPRHLRTLHIRQEPTGTLPTIRLPPQGHPPNIVLVFSPLMLLPAIESRACDTTGALPATSTTPSPNEGELLTVAEAAATLGLAPSTLHRWLGDGFIAGEQTTPGAPWRIR
jgi:hypothetical protein